MPKTKLIPLQLRVVCSKHGTELKAAVSYPPKSPYPVIKVAACPDCLAAVYHEAMVVETLPIENLYPDQRRKK